MKTEIEDLGQAKRFVDFELTKPSNTENLPNIQNFSSSENESDEEEHFSEPEDASELLQPNNQEDLSEEDKQGFNDIADARPTLEETRGRGRPRIIRTGQPGRPRKQYQPGNLNRTGIAEPNEETFLSEVPMKEAMKGPNANEWHQAIVEEIKSIIKKDTWTLVDRPEQGEVIGCRMVLRNKLKPDGTLERRKARLVAQGFNQKPGIHFSETFAPVARIGSIRIMTSLAARYGMNIQQFDIATAYLNGELEEEVLMEIPKNFEETLQSIIDSEEENQVRYKAKNILLELRKGNKVCHLEKSLYGLRQAGRSWYVKLDKALRKYGAIPTKSDPCLFQIGSGEDVTLIAVYVDDILIASRSQKKIAELGRKLAMDFEVKDLGPVSYY